MPNNRKKHQDNDHQELMQSRFNDLWLTASADGLRSVLTTRSPVALTSSLTGSTIQGQILAQATTELQEYFTGTRTVFTIPLAPRGTVFQQLVWHQLRQIPYGATCSYSDIAAAMGKPQAARAVGSANGKNPLCIIVPCHRVIAADGSLGGYSGGLELKLRLINLEQKMSVR